MVLQPSACKTKTMARIQLTINKIDNFQCPEGKSQVFLWDSEVAGLALRCTPQRKTFVFQAELHGKSVRITIGEYPAWRLDGTANSKTPNARRRARELRGMIDQGIDPRQIEQQAKAEFEQQQQEENRQQFTLAQLWDAYVDANKARWSTHHLDAHSRLIHRGGEARVRSKIKHTIPGPLASLLDTKLTDLSAECIAQWLEQENSTRKTVAALAFRMLRACINWGNEQTQFAGLVPSGAHTSKKVRRNVAKSQAKNDCLQKEQLLAWFEAVKQLSPVISVFLQSLLLTGARREELAAMRWEDVDFKWSMMTIHDKVEGKRIIPLTPYVSVLLSGLPRRNEWVFSSPGAASGRIQDPLAAHSRAITVAGLPKLTLHGLRRSFGSLAEWVGCPVGISAQIMGHKPTAIAEKHYRVRPLDLLRKWHCEIEKWILEQADIKQPEPFTGQTKLHAIPSSALL